MAYVALLDASVLHPWVICDLLLQLAERGLYRPAWSAAILDELVQSLIARKPEHAERFQRRRERMEAAFAEAMAERSERFLAAVPEEVDGGDRHVVAAAFAARADVIVTNNIRHFAPERLAESGLIVQTADEFLIHHWWLDPQGVDEVLAEMAAATTRPPLTVAEVLEEPAPSRSRVRELGGARPGAGRRTLTHRQQAVV